MYKRKFSIRSKFDINNSIHLIIFLSIYCYIVSCYSDIIYFFIYIQLLEHVCNWKSSLRCCLRRQEVVNMSSNFLLLLLAGSWVHPIGHWQFRNFRPQAQSEHAHYIGCWEKRQLKTDWHENYKRKTYGNWQKSMKNCNLICNT